MRRLVALVIGLALAGSIAACGGGASPSPIQGSPSVTTPASPKPSPSSGYDYGGY